MVDLNKERILTYQKVEKMVKRMVYQIWEHNFDSDTIILAGINGQGFELAKILHHELQSITQVQISLLKIKLSKIGLLSQVVDFEPSSIPAHKPVIIVDDVLNSGKTIFLALKAFYTQSASKIEIAVLVNRYSLDYPIQVKYEGYQLYTTVNQIIKVFLTGKNKGVYLIEN